MIENNYIKMLERKLERLAKSSRYPFDKDYLNAYKNIEKKLNEYKKSIC